ncbi:Organic cation/carnitine transporter 4 [Linum grandiflorum]
MRSIAAGNGRRLPDGVVLALDEDLNNNDDETTGKASGSLVDVIKSPVTRIRLFLSVAISFSSAVVYYGLSLNVVNLDTNLYLSVLVNAVAEMPSYTLTAVLLEWFGCLVEGEGATWKVVKMVCGVFGIFGMAGTYNLLFIYAAELFPTVVRNAALGCATQASQFGAILAPFVVVMGSLAFLLPETLNQPLYDTMSGLVEGGKLDGSILLE